MAKKTFSIGANLANAMTETSLIAHEHSGELHIEAISISKIELDPENPRDLLLTKEDVIAGLDKQDPEYPRKKSEMESLTSLSESINSQGLINPVLVYKTPTCYRLVAGERRLLASLIGRKESIQAKILDKKPSQLKLSLLQWIENMERSDLTLGERLQNIQLIVTALQQERGSEKVTGLDLAQAISISKTVAYNYMKVLTSSNDIKELIQTGKIRNLEVACLILQSEEPLKTQLIELSIDGASLDRLQNFAKGFASKPTAQPQIKNGRPTQKISFPKISNTQVAKAIAESILQNPRFAHLSALFSDTLWNDKASINDAFSKLIQNLEKEFK